MFVALAAVTVWSFIENKWVHDKLVTVKIRYQNKPPNQIGDYLGSFYKPSQASQASGELPRAKMVSGDLAKDTTTAKWAAYLKRGSMSKAWLGR